MTRKIAIIGANIQQNPLIIKAKEMGFETHVFAWQSGSMFGEKTADYFYPISTENKEQILSKCQEIGVIGVVSIGSDIAAISAAYVCEKMGLVSNSYASVLCATNKIISRKLFERCSILQPEFIEIGDSLPVEELKKLRFPLVVKPSDRSGGRGLLVAKTQGQLEKAINQARELSFERKAIVEEFLNGGSYSCEYISYNKKHILLGITKRTIFISPNGKICEKKHEQPSNLPTKVIIEMQQSCVDILNCLGIRYGASSVEFIVINAKCYVIEVTPSMYGDFIGTDIIPLAEGFDYLRMVIDIATGRELNVNTVGGKSIASVDFIYSRNDVQTYNLQKKNNPSVIVSSRIDDEDIPSEPGEERYGHYIIDLPFKQFGGCPCLILNNGAENFQEIDSKIMLRLNSEMTAFWYVLKINHIRSIAVPFYCSSVWEKLAKDFGIIINYYHIGKDFLPKDLFSNSSDFVVLINYFDFCRDFIYNYTTTHSNVIIDNSMAFFAPPIIKEQIYNIYSCRKFFSVSDGAYLISLSISTKERISLERDVSYKRARMLLQSLELGENSAYKEQQRNEQELLKDRKEMSLLTEKLLCSINYKQERKSRRENYQTLDRILKGKQLLFFQIEDDIVPQFYPLMVNVDIRDVLVSRGVYVPLMWRKCLSPEFSGCVEQLLSEKMLCLPIDSRYSIMDMEYLGTMVSSLLS